VERTAGSPPVEIMGRIETIRAIETSLESRRAAAGFATTPAAPDAPAVETILDRHGRASAQIIAILQDLQEQHRYLPEPELRYISRQLDVPMTRLYAIATFYKAFRLEPRGRHEGCLCMGTACHVRGGERVKDAIERSLGVAAGETTADMRFSFETVRCLGCCGQAPVMTVDGKIYGKLDHLTVGAALESHT
jgi:NADH-quinone oxidoreductase subunit E